MGYKSLFLLNYNQYYNRLVKKEETIDAYAPYIVYGPDEANTYKLIVSNFNPNDGINTEHVFNVPEPNFDYVVVLDENNEIDSRWFVIQAERTRGNQYKTSLRRDLVADLYDEAIGATCYIERAMINYGNKLIYNSENLPVNQIKKGETLLKDITGCPWIVGYVALDGVAQDTQIDSSTTSVDAPVLSSFTYEQFNDMAANGINKITSITIQADGYSNFAIDPQTVYSFKFGAESSYSKRQKTNEDQISLYYYTNKIGSKQGPAAATTIQQTYETMAAEVQTNAETYVDAEIPQSILNENEVAAALSQNGLLVAGSDGTLYVATLAQTGTTAASFKPKAGALYENLIKIMQDTNVLAVPSTGLANKDGFTLTVEMETYTAAIKAYDGQTFNATLKPANKILKDAPYKMFCIPYPLDNNSGRTWYSKINAEGEYEHTEMIPDKQAGLNFAMAIAKKLDKKLYDLQLLPYCPAREWTTAVNPTWGNGPIAIQDELILERNGSISQVNDEVLTPVVANGKFLTYALWCETSSMSFIIKNPISVPTNALDFKLEHETSFYRLVSPNYSGAFQFKATANQGVDYFNINCTYKPLQPYIHVAPNFKGLYGGDYNDARGLICGGDFSLPTLSDAWEQYQINNKSYMESFNRQIENMELTYNIQRSQQKEGAIINAITAGIGGATSGAFAGSIGGAAGTITGAAIGGTIGTAASIYGMNRDLMYSNQLYNEAKSFAQDQFNLSLQNIQALPYSLNRVGAYDINNKYFPFLEFYSCSDEEKEAVKNFILYNSMTVNAIGTIESYMQGEPTFIRAQLIRIDNLAEDYHAFAELASELHKGIYI